MNHCVFFLKKHASDFHVLIDVHQASNILVMHQGHWRAIEITKKRKTVHVTLVGFRDNKAKYDALKAIAHSTGVLSQNLPTQVVAIQTPADMCGWVILSSWMHRYEIKADWPLSGVQVPFDAITDDPDLLQRSACIRQGFLHCLQHWEKKPLFAGGEEDDASMDKPDPWQAKDPWSIGTVAKRARWEDLHLLEDHPFYDDANKHLIFRPKQQLSGTCGGIAFCNKNGIADFVSHPPSSTTILIIPANDKSTAFQHVVPGSIKGPFEVTVSDPHQKQVYKRQVICLELVGRMVFKLPQASYQATLEAVAEIVVEAGSRLTTKDYMSGFGIQALGYFKLRIAEQFPQQATKSMNVFGLRAIQHGKEHAVLQVICRIPATQRAAFIAKSGVGDLIARDFIPKDAEAPADVSVIPRFFECPRAGQESILKATSDIKGFAGLQVTPRHLAVRAWTENIASLRQTLLPCDPRLRPENIGVAPRFIYNSHGWPPAISPSEVVKSTLRATKLPCVPTRCSRVNNVTCWAPCFHQHPQNEKFTAAFNQVVFEILLSPASKVYQVPKKENSGKTRSDRKVASSEKATSSESKAEADNRITVLEARMSSVEQRQDGLESKLDDGFNAIQSQLRQVLNAVKPRPASGHTGETPPTKATS